jgi:hypothetical protein
VQFCPLLNRFGTAENLNLRFSANCCTAARETADLPCVLCQLPKISPKIAALLRHSASLSAAHKAQAGA